MELLSDEERWGRLIRAAREGELFITQAELAAKIVDIAGAAGVELTVDQSTVSRWEKGDHAPALRARPFVAKALDLPPAVLFQRTEAVA